MNILLIGIGLIIVFGIIGFFRNRKTDMNPHNNMSEHQHEQSHVHNHSGRRHGCCN